MKNKLLTYLLAILLYVTPSIGAGGSSSGGESAGKDGPPPASKYKLGESYVLEAKSLERKAEKLIEKGKEKKAKKTLEKAKKKYIKAQNFLLEANKEKAGDPDTLNYLGFTTRKLGDYENAEIYYLLGLEIDPNHNGINEYLGELYIATNRMELAKERLNILKNCNCEEYQELKEIIEGTKKSKY